ncbi:MAG: hypothetical protein ACRDTG_29185 [Pseudonocardiaceae bacterium]
MAADDLLTLAEARRAVNLPLEPSDQDIDLALFVTGLSGRVDALCGPVVRRAVNGERHDGGRKKVLLGVHHASSVTSVAEWVNTTETVLSEETDSTKPANGFLLHTVLPYGWVIRRTGNADSVFPAGRRNVVITYQAGRYADTDSVGNTFKLAASAALRRLWKREQSSWAHTPDFFADTENPRPQLAFYKTVDPMIHELLAHELLPPVGL